MNNSHLCALLSDQTIRCLGKNESGQLGNGMTIDSSLPVGGSGISSAISIVVGSQHTCALLTDGLVKCWGRNQNGQLGNGTTENSTTPVAVSGISNATAIASALESTSVLLSDGTVKCWGKNNLGQLGNGTTDASPTPVTVSNLSMVTTLASGERSVCALLSDGTIYCWGANDRGQFYTGLGSRFIFNPSGPPLSYPSFITVPIAVTGNDGPTFSFGGDTVYPATVRGVPNATGLIGGGYNFCAVSVNNQVTCWGAHIQALFRQGYIAAPTPVTIEGLSQATSITAGTLHVCGLFPESVIRCLGFNDALQLGFWNPGVVRELFNSKTPMDLTYVFRLAGSSFFPCEVSNNVCFEYLGDF